ncbi:precorrin-2 dehydrogenase / sirohydrochlorin ferrochelatase [Alteribacillus persepolensis]|uniref:precorrin-2 dehydrogenase n=1 Tax=Alteribacillus persepolensis TaxID=568899 RepID=A0A1G8C9D4_9BACI|nr:bifunctional precorrin-2 dehydrogenase/sirohydrochlorin ferrochelatase [Alteribacillus persepolensis]SDH42064.1 precorrin-2 dehydrogenase / sirohydrochlorin ferrochelatase [Alteribacillus persepolensis]
MFNFPVFLTLENKDAVVIGGGKIAARKIHKLHAAAANITVIAPDLHADLKEMVQSGEIIWINDTCKPEHIASAFMIVSASGNKQAQEIIQQSAASHQLINGADNPSIGNVALPASIENDDYHIAVSTRGKSPAKAKQLKHRLMDWLNDNR